MDRPERPASDTTPRIRSVCTTCGAAYERDDGPRRAECYTCRPAPLPTPSKLRRGSTRARGYGGSWRRLSERARRLSPQCEDCGATDDLTADHSVEAWRRHDEGKTIRLQDVAVVCRRCNGERGAARGDRAGQHARWEQSTVDQLDDLADTLTPDPDELV